MRIIEFVLDLIYPKRCVVCSEVIEFENKVHICKACDELIDAAHGIIDKNENISSTKVLDNIKASYSVLPYKKVKKGIQDFKFDGCKNNGIYLADIMYRVAVENFPKVFHDNDLILSVPIHKEKLKERGFNQAEVLAELISVKSGIPIVKNQLLRCLNTEPQSGLDRKKRAKNLKDAFEIYNFKTVWEKRILLIDDINTTGTTLNECGRALLEAGAKEVTAFSLATALLEDDN